MLSDQVIMAIIASVPPTLASITALIVSIRNKKSIKDHVTKESDKTREAMAVKREDIARTAERSVPRPVMREPTIQPPDYWRGI